MRRNPTIVGPSAPSHHSNSVSFTFPSSRMVTGAIPLRHLELCSPYPTLALCPSHGFSWLWSNSPVGEEVLSG